MVESPSLWSVYDNYSWSGPDGNGYAPTACGMSYAVHSVSWYDAVKWCNARSEKEGFSPVYRVNGEIYRSGEFGATGSTVVQWSTAANGYRLPTELEWIFAASGGVNPDGFIYSGSNSIDAVAWHSSNSFGSPCDLLWGWGPNPVGTLLPNSLGLYDMSGGVFEWCWESDGNVRVIKGGSWWQNEHGCRIDFYHGWNPNVRLPYGGFRTVRHVFR